MERARSLISAMREIGVMSLFKFAAAVALTVPTFAFAGQVTLHNTTGGAVEIRAVRAGKVTIPEGETRTFLYQAEDGDFRVWTAGDKCDHVFLYETADDVTLQVAAGPTLFKLPAGAAKADTAALGAGQSTGWPMKPSDKVCD